MPNISAPTFFGRPNPGVLSGCVAGLSRIIERLHFPHLLCMTLHNPKQWTSQNKQPQPKRDCDESILNSKKVVWFPSVLCDKFSACKNKCFRQVLREDSLGVWCGFSFLDRIKKVALKSARRATSRTILPFRNKLPSGQKNKTKQEKPEAIDPSEKQKNVLKSDKKLGNEWTEHLSAKPQEGKKACFRVEFFLFHCRANIGWQNSAKSHAYCELSQQGTKAVLQQPLQQNAETTITLFVRGILNSTNAVVSHRLDYIAQGLRIRKSSRAQVPFFCCNSGLSGMLVSLSASCPARKIVSVLASVTQEQTGTEHFSNCPVTSTASYSRDVQHQLSLFSSTPEDEGYSTTGLLRGK